VREITFCERSTITEAWAVVHGRSVPVIPEEPAAIIIAVKRALPTLEREPAMVVAEVPQKGPVAPFWSQQWSWDYGRLLARIGHRYLGVHRLADEDHRYETYERSLAPAIGPWLEACAQVYDDPLIMQALEQVGYGYINTFSFPAAGFDLARVVRMELGIQLEGIHDGLDGFDVRLHYRDEDEPGARVAIHVLVQSDGPIPDTVLVRTKVTAKAVAKRAFFRLVTDETQHMMGARHGDPT
jgi:hypothetical protein